MNFEDFRKEIELRLISKIKFELIEYSFLPYSFGSGILAYRINGQNHKFVFDGKDNELTWLKSKSHEKYNENEFTEYGKFEGLKISDEVLWKGLKNVA
jgi:Txe/YoeB family toxin of Txe-Axe toxin-antitoxin module